MKLGTSVVAVVFGLAATAAWAAEPEDAGSDRSAGSAIRPGTFQPSTLEDFRAATQDKLVVILPSGWRGSVPELIAALEDKADASEILVLSQDEDDDTNASDDE